jgi:uncharacterized protein YcbK (DUF882 family)
MPLAHAFKATSYYSRFHHSHYDKTLTNPTQLPTPSRLKIKQARRHDTPPSTEQSPLNLRLPSVPGPLKRTQIRTAFTAIALTAVCLLTPAHAMRNNSTTPVKKVTPTLSSQKYELKLRRLHGGESLDVVYRIGNTYIPSALASLNHILRDDRTQATSHYDPKEFDLLHAILTRLNKNGSVIDIVCGYRSPATNSFLRTRGGTVSPALTGVAKNSEHTQAKAIDIRVPGVSTARLRNAALSLHGGGVGYYPVSRFVHVDVGPVRHWTFYSHNND